MKARIIKVNPQNPEEHKIKIAAEALQEGKLVIIPTETVYGIAADARNPEAISRLYDIKQRTKDKPFSLLMGDKHRIEDYAQNISRQAYKLIDKFWPGPLTVILQAKDNSNIGLRVPDNNVCLQLISAAGTALACPSANISGKPAPVDFPEAIKDLEQFVDVAIDGGRTQLGRESSVVDLVQTPYKVLRQAAISAEQIDKVAQRKNILFVCTGNSCRSVMAKAYLDNKLKELGRQDIEVLSAGILGISNLGVSQQTKSVLEKEGIEIGQHKSIKVTDLMIKKSEMVLVMESMHEQRILELVPEARTRLFLLKEFSKSKDNSLDIQDPIGQSVGFHEEVFSIIKESIDELVPIL